MSNSDDTALSCDGERMKEATHAFTGDLWNLIVKHFPGVDVGNPQGLDIGQALRVLTVLGAVEGTLAAFMMVKIGEGATMLRFGAASSEGFNIGADLGAAILRKEHES